MNSSSSPGQARTDRNGLEVLDEQRCVHLISNLVPAIGRLAVVLDERPLVMPINYCWYDGTVVVRTTSGTKLDAAYQTAPVAFEVDEVDARWQGGWSVLIEGRAAAVEDDARIEELESLPLRRWTPDRPTTFVEIIPSKITGRRL